MVCLFIWNNSADRARDEGGAWEKPCANKVKTFDGGLYPNGQYAVCSWRQYDNNINKFIKNNKIDWKAFFNSYYYRKQRKNFKNFCYKDCLINCPAAEKISEKDFNKKYSI